MIDKLLSIGEQVISWLFNRKDKRDAALEFYRRQVRSFEQDDSPARAKEAFEQLETNAKKPPSAPGG